MLADRLMEVITVELGNEYDGLCLKTILKWLDVIAGPRPGPTAAEAQEELRRK